MERQSNYSFNCAIIHFFSVTSTGWRWWPFNRSADHRGFVREVPGNIHQPLGSSWSHQPRDRAGGTNAGGGNSARGTSSERKRRGDWEKGMVQLWAETSLRMVRGLESSLLNSWPYNFLSQCFSPWCGCEWVPASKLLTLYTLTSVCKFSVLFSMHFLRCW